MTDETKHINYSLADIERYLQGSMSAKEMHEMEKAALQDLFLADAIEGYSEASLKQAHKHLNEINAALHAKQNDAKIIAFSTVKKYSWWKIAAMILLVAGAGIGGWYILNNSSDTHQLAQEKTNTTEQKQTPATATPLADSVVQNNSADNDTKSLTRLKKDNEEKIPASASAQNASGSSSFKKELYAEENIPDSDNVVATITSSAKADEDVASKQMAPVTQALKISHDSLNFNVYNNFLNGRIVNTNNQFVANATIAVKGLKDSVKTNNEGYFSIPSFDKNANVTVVAPGYKTVDTVLNKNMNLIVVTNAPSWLSQIPVTDLKSNRSTTTNEAFTNNNNQTTPQGGWISFQDYVYQKLHKERDTLNSPVVISGNVEIEFSVSRDGIPYDFKILKSLDPESDARAISILKDGPRWIATQNNKKGKVTIQF